MTNKSDEVTLNHEESLRSPREPHLCYEDGCKSMGIFYLTGASGNPEWYCQKHLPKPQVFKT